MADRGDFVHGPQGGRWHIGASDISGLIPAHALPNRMEKVAGGIHLYHKPLVVSRPGGTSSNPYKLEYLLEEQGGLRPFTFRHGREVRHVQVCRGYIEDERGLPLLVLCRIGADPWDREGMKDRDRLMLFVSHDLASAPLYKALHAKVHKIAIAPHVRNGVTVVHATSRWIRDRVYDSGLEFGFPSLEAMDEHLRTVPKRLLELE